MSTDNITPIGPHVALPPAVTDIARLEGWQNWAVKLETALSGASERVSGQRVRIFQAMGVISCAAAAAPTNVAEGEPDLRYALEAAHSILDAVCTELDPSHFTLEEVEHG